MCTGGASCPRHTCACVNNTPTPERDWGTHKTQTQHVFVESTCAHKWRLSHCRIQRMADRTHLQSRWMTRAAGPWSRFRSVGVWRCELCVCGCRPLPPLFFVVWLPRGRKGSNCVFNFSRTEPNKHKQASYMYSPTAKAELSVSHESIMYPCRKGVDIL
jgi:hypothetical protein